MIPNTIKTNNRIDSILATGDIISEETITSYGEKYTKFSNGRCILETILTIDVGDDPYNISKTWVYEGYFISTPKVTAIPEYNDEGLVICSINPSMSSATIRCSTIPETIDEEGVVSSFDTSYRIKVYAEGRWQGEDIYYKLNGETVITPAILGQTWSDHLGSSEVNGLKMSDDYKTVYNAKVGSQKIYASDFVIPDFDYTKLNLITFSIIPYKLTADIPDPYTAEEGMTWREFVNSEYNVDGGWEVIESYDFIGYNGDTHLRIAMSDTSGYHDVSPDEVIVNQGEYWVNSEPT